jgi:hypothetical protein
MDFSAIKHSFNGKLEISVSNYQTHILLNLSERGISFHLFRDYPQSNELQIDNEGSVGSNV